MKGCGKTSACNEPPRCEHTGAIVKDQVPEVESEDLREHGEQALRLARTLNPGESVRWADLVNALHRWLRSKTKTNRSSRDRVTN